MSDEYDFGPEQAASELQALQKQLSQLQVENSRLKEVIVDNDLQNEVEFDCGSIEEKICINGIRYIAELVEAQNFEKKDVESFEKLREKGIEATIKLSESPNTKVVVIGNTKDGLPLILGDSK